MKLGQNSSLLGCFVIAGNAVGIHRPSNTDAGEAGVDRGPGLAKEQEQGQEAEDEAGGLHAAVVILIWTPGWQEHLWGISGHEVD